MKKLLPFAVICAGLWLYYSQKVLPDQRAWAEATATNSIASMMAYLDSFPTGARIAEARRRIDALRNDDSAFELAFNAGTLDALRRFLLDYPGHRREDAVRAQVAAGDVGPLDVVELLQQGKIELTATGDGIERVAVDLRGRTKYPLVITLPAGLLFVPADRSDQTMMATESKTIRLFDSQPQSHTVPVACTNWAKNVPDRNDRMTVQRAVNANLAFIAPVLARTANPVVRQAIVWIITDNTSYRDLGKLVSGFCFFDCEADRVIGPNEAGEAIKILVEAGVDLRSWKIWRDRTRIHAGMDNPELRAWFSANAMNR